MFRYNNNLITASRVLHVKMDQAMRKTELGDIHLDVIVVLYDTGVAMPIELEEGDTPDEALEFFEAQIIGN